MSSETEFLDPIIGTSDDDILDGTDGPEQIKARAGDDRVKPDLGDDQIFLGSGSDIVLGKPDALLGDTVKRFGLNDSLIFKRVEFEMDDTDKKTNKESVKLRIDYDQDGDFDGFVRFEGDFSDGDFFSVAHDGQTTVTFAKYLPRLKDGRAVDEDDINGIVNQEFLEGDGDTAFKVKLDKDSESTFDNVLGVYKISKSGKLRDVEVLFDNTQKDGGDRAFITDVNDGQELGFFMVQNRARVFEQLDDDANIKFVDSKGNRAKLNDDNDLILRIDGEDTNYRTFHSYSKDMNINETEHVLSGISSGGSAIEIGFESGINGGDRDYQDILFKVWHQDPDDVPMG